jgi:4'-phosphopantetheinyl transferase
MESAKASLMVRVVGLGERGHFAELLTDGERGRAEKITSDSLRARFVVSRGLRRKLLSEVMGRAASELEFIEDGETKPRLLDHDGWDFNMSHAGDYVAVAAGRCRVGIDLEKMREVPEMEAIMDRYFHPDEAAAWRALDESLRAEGFFVLWSAREAAMKCCGLGLAKGLSVTRIDPAFLHERAAEAKVGDEVVEVEKFDAPAGYLMVVGKEQGGRGKPET